MKKYFLLFAVCFLISTPASAMTAKDLQIMCVGLTEKMKTACDYYIFGVAEGAELEAGTVGDKTHFCIPGGVKTDQLALIVRAGMEGDFKMHPLDANMPASSFVGAVLIRAFPCAQK